MAVFGIALCNIDPVHSQCELNAELAEEIRNYQPVVNQIIEKTLNGDFKGKLFDDTATFVDTIGARYVLYFLFQPLFSKLYFSYYCQEGRF